MKKLVLLFLLLLVVPSIIAVTVDPDVELALNSSSRVSVIVFYNDNAQVNVASARAVQDAQPLRTQDLKVDHAYHYSKGFSGNISSKGLEYLKNNPQIKSIHLSRTYYVELTQALPIVNASLAHAIQINGVNLTGSQRTVCVLDTGINYSHSSFGSCTSSQVQAGTCAKVVNGTDLVNNDNDPYDDNGHGTHVAGIVAANGSIRGVAPQARLAIVKVCNAAGSCSDANVLAGIEWCTDYAEENNISVISMSLGDGNSYASSGVCPTTFNSAINSAVAKNISVVVASGNQNHVDGISSPACAPNVTSIGATYDANVGSKTWCTSSGCATSCTDSSTVSDKIVCFTNRFANLDLLAPGAIITSTDWDGTSEDRSGTSMSTPLIAGMFAIMQQYYSQENSLTLNNTYAEFILNKSGFAITDSASSTTFSRVNLNDALVLLDEKNPSVFSFTTVSNQSSLTNVTISANISDSHLSNIYLESDFSGSDINYSMSNSGSNYSYTISSNNFSVGQIVTYRIIAFDSNNNTNITSQRSFNIGSTVSLSSPANGFVTSSSSVNFNFSISDSLNLSSNCTLYIDSSSNASNFTVLSNNLTNFSVSNIAEGVHTWNVDCNDSSNMNISSGVRSFDIDQTPPSITLNAPSNASSSAYSTIKFNFTAIDRNIDNCTLRIDGFNNVTNTSMLNGSLTNLQITLGNSATNLWSVACVDSANNMNASSNRSITTNVPSTPSGNSGSSGGSGGGGGGGSKLTPSTEPVIQSTPSEPSIFIAPTEDLDSSSSFEVSAKQGSLRKFKIYGSEHSVTFKEVNDDSVVLEFKSDPVIVSLSVSDTKDVDLDSDGVNDISVTLNSIIDGSVDISIKNLGNSPASSGVTSAAVVGEKLPSSFFSFRNVLFLVLGVILIGLVLFFIFRKSLREFLNN